MKSNLQRDRGFSLVELLVVIAIIGLLAGISIVSIRGTSGPANLSSGGTQLAGFLELARQTAITKASPVAVAIVASGETSANRVFTALQFQSETESWARISKWENLPQGVVMDSADTSFLPQNSPAIEPALPALEYAGNSFAPRVASGYGYIVFLSNGSLYPTDTKSCVLHLVEGVPSASGPILTGAKDAQGKPANFFEIVVNDATGNVKINRPH